MVPHVDSLNYVSENNVRAKETFLELTYQYNLTDAWRHKNPTERKYTWRRNNPLKAGRLDMYFVSDEILGYLKDLQIMSGYRTDHNIITMSIKIKRPRGGGLWKFNTSHLADDAYIRKIKMCISQTLQQYAVPLYTESVYNNYECYANIQLTISEILFYETLIMLIRGETVKFSKQEAKRRRMRQTLLEEQIFNLEQKFAASGEQSDAIELDLLKNSLEEMRRPMIDGLIVRSRVAWHEQGERNTKYFLSLEKRNSTRKSIQFIQDENEVLEENDQILNRFSNIFQIKYTASRDTFPESSFVRKNVHGRLNANEKGRIDNDIQLVEVTEVLKCMKEGKTLGSNGFPIEFSVAFGMS